MGKHSHVRVENQEPGCVWTVFRLMNYHPWHNVKKMLPSINYKPNKVRNENIEFSNEHEFEEDSMTNYSDSVNSSPSRNGSGSRKRSIKARIKALLADKANKSSKVNTIQEHELLALKEACNDLGPPTLISYLKSNPTLITTFNPTNESSNLNRATSIKQKDSNSKEDYVGVLELFKVDQETFVKVVQDKPPKKHRLVKSGSFPFSKCVSRHSTTFGRTPSKLEHKHNEIWPTPSQAHELRKAKSHNIVRSSSLKESLDKYNQLIDYTTSNRKGLINRQMSKSLKLRNEIDFGPLGDQHGRKSFRERMYLSEGESEAPRASLDCFLNNMSQADQVRVLRLDSPPTETINELNTGVISFVAEEGESIQQVEIVELIEDCNCDLNVDFQQDQIEKVDWPILEDSPTVSHRTPAYEIDDDVQGVDAQSILMGEYEMDRSNENFQYVKYILEIIGFTTTIDQLEAWHSPEQPLDPALFDGIEICCPFEPKPSSKKDITISMSSTTRKILFDLINEAIFDIHENSYSYYPKALSYGCVVHPEPKGRSRAVEQVWKFAREWLQWQAEIDVELNMAMGHELSRHKNGWSNLQTDIELLAIDLEDCIFSELLDEIVCC